MTDPSSSREHGRDAGPGIRVPPGGTTRPADAASDGAGPRVGRLYANELLKLVARKRSHIGFGAFLALEIAFLALLHLPRVRASIERLLSRNGLPVEQYFSGTTVAVMIVALTVLFLGALFIALVAGDIVAKEAEDGTLRMLLCRPVSRLQLLVAKASACATYSAALILFIGASALAMGLAYRGWGSLFVFSPAEGVFAFHPPWPGLARYALAIAALALTTQTFTAVAFMFSCFNMKPAAATILTLAGCFIDLLLRMTPYFESIREWFLTHHMAVWIHLFEPHVPWARLAEALVFLAAWDITFVAIGIAHFLQRDIRS